MDVSSSPYPNIDESRLVNGSTEHIQLIQNTINQFQWVQKSTLLIIDYIIDT